MKRQQGRGVRISRCPAAVKGTKAHNHKPLSRDTAGWEGRVVDLTGRYTIGKGLSVYTRINNTLNKKYCDDAYEAPGLYVIGGLSWDFGFGQ